MVTAVSQTVLQVGDPVNATAVCGSNTVAAVGASASGGTGSSTGTFDLLCSTTPTTGGSTGTTPTTVSTGTTPTTAAPATVPTAPPATASPAPGPLALTGARIIEALLIAAALIGLGTVLVVFQRRRRRTT